MTIQLEKLGYKQDEKSHVWMKLDYPGIQYNDGDEVEDRIAAIIKNADDISVLSTELRQHCTDWPSLYHLTGTRANIMRPFEAIYKNANVLEIGAGCGAITRYLGESGANVLALEGSPRRAAIARSRTRDLQNVTVVAEKFDQFKCDEQFDIVTLIGVLEYANLFTPGENPHLNMLQRVRQLLKPDGKLIIAIENQLGLKYFAGANEDHLGEPMIGIEGRYRKDEPQTFGRQKLKALLAQASFSNSSFLAPFPDYKLPVSIVTEAGFEAECFDAAAFAWQSSRRDPQLPAYSNFSLELAWPEVIKNGLGMDLSSSFLICASQSNEPLVLPNELAYHYSSDRKPEFCKETLFIRTSNNTVNVKYNQISKKFNNNNNNNKKTGHLVKYVFPKSEQYTLGKPLSYEFIKIVTNDNWTFDQVAVFIKKYVTFLLNETLISNDILKNSDKYPFATKIVIPGVYIDALPQNIICQSNNELSIIDKEWQLNEPMELGYLLYRTMFSLLNQVTRFGRHNTEATVTRHDLVNRVLATAGYIISDVDVEKYIEIETNVQQYITGRLPALNIDWGQDRPLHIYNLTQAFVERNEQVKLLQSHVEKLDVADAERQTRIEQLDIAAAEKQTHIEQLVIAAAERQTHIKQLDIAAADRQAHIESQDIAAVEREAKVSQLSQTLRDLQQRVGEMQNSSSWRITAPLRFTSRQIKRIPKVVSLALPAIKLGGGVISTSQKALKLYKREGISGIKRGFRLAAAVTTSSLLPVMDAGLKPTVERNDYDEWVRHYDTLTDTDRDIMRVHQSKFVHQPVISVLMSSCSAEPQWLIKVIESVKSQIYPHWELCVADNSGTNSNARQVLERYSAADARIKVALFPQSGNAAELTKQALDLANGTWLVLLGLEDLLTENALFWIAHAANQNHSVQLMYADEDKIDIASKRYDPYFKCDWNVDLFYSQNMLGRLVFFKADLLRQIGGYRDNFGVSTTYDLVLRCIEHIKPEQIGHIPRVLHHQATQIKSTSGSSLVLSQQTAATVPDITGVQALNEHFQRLGIKASAEISAQSYRIRYSLPDVLPLVTIIIPTRNGLMLLRQCIDSIVTKTTYSNYEILIIDNGSDDPETLTYLQNLAQNQRFTVLRDDGPFNYSALNNAAVKIATGELVALVNNDIEVITPDWLSEMVVHALRNNVGAVGARLWYPNNTLQHAGVILGCHGLAGHVHKKLAKNKPGYFNRANVVQNYSAITAACMVVKKSLFEEVGGFNEKDLCIAFNDVDLCAKLQAAGYRNLWTPYADLYHHESATRGPDDANQAALERTAKEASYIQKNWSKLLAHDPAYSPNLSIESEDCSLAWPPRVAKLSLPKSVAGTLHKHYLFLTYRMTLGWGVDVAVANIAQQMMAMGYKVTIGCLDKDDFYDGLDIVVLKNDQHSVDELIKKIGCDCVVAHTSPFFEMLPKLGSAIPKWAMEYGDPTPEFFPLDGKERSHIKHDKMINCYPFVDGVIGISKFIRSDIQWPSAKIVYMGCDHAPDRGPKGLFDFDQRPDALLKVGTLMRLGKGESHYKGNQLFLELVAKCKKENKTAQFYVMGRGTPEDAHFFESMGIEVHLNAPDDKKWDYLRGLDIFISPSQWEGFNLPLAEAQALGTIGLAFDTGAHPEVTPHIVSSVDEAAALIQQMAQNKTLLLQESAFAYRFVRNQFSWKKSAVDLLQITSGN
jgi:O-antigen biosynthesis protein